MAEEDEIDVLGEFNLDTLLSKNNREIYNYDHPQWALDHQNPSSWYHHTTSDFNSSLSQSIETDFIETNDDLVFNNSHNFSNYNSDVIEEKINNVWNDKEKDLFEKALEIFGRSPGRISQFIGTKSPAEVKYYMKNYSTVKSSLIFNDLYKDHTSTKQYVELSDSVQNPLADSDFSGLIVESQIPASIEEVIAAVNTAQPTVSHLIPKNKTARRRKEHQFKLNLISKTKKGNQIVSITDIPSGHSVLKKNILEKVSNHRNKYFIGNKNSLKVLHKNKFVSERSNKRKRVVKKTQKSATLSSTDLHLVTGKGLSVPLSSGEEVITIKNTSDVESDTEVEIDIDDSGEANNLRSDPKAVTHDTQDIFQNCEINTEEHNFHDNQNIEMIVDHHETTTSTDLNDYMCDAVDHSSRLCEEGEPYNKTVDEVLMLKLSSDDIPTEECKLNHNVITDEEMYIHCEFFEGRPTKTPERYLKIRNHILNSWYVSKPLYVTKTSVRSGLKSCGDVNSIGRVHQYLEQIGAINFGCSQTEYKRPLNLLLASHSVQTINSKNKVPNENPSAKYQGKNESMRARNKKKLIIDGEGGYTLKHNENGDIIETIAITQSSKQQPIKKNIKLINCQEFNHEYTAPYNIKLHISALLSMDWHSHTSLSEVMGLLGGYFNNCENTLYITRYVSCRSATNSTVHCDMCPVSQTEASEMIQSENLDVVGWFHSHPVFSPNPSQQDLDTQLNMQNWFFNMKSHSPFIGIILSPFCNTSNRLISDYRCIIVNAVHDDNEETKWIPYKFETEIISHKVNTQQLLSYAAKIFSSEANLRSKIDLTKPYFQDASITYMEKIIATTRLHLAKCHEITQSMYTSIIDGLLKIFYK